MDFGTGLAERPEGAGAGAVPARMPGASFVTTPGGEVAGEVGEPDGDAQALNARARNGTPTGRIGLRP
jgi:hypothetical protein